MKRIFASVIIVSIVILSIVSVSAANGNVASLKLDYKTNENGNIVVSASIVGITEPSGLSAVIYNINTDPTALEYVNANVSLPSSWEILSKDSMYKDAFEADFFKSPYSDENGVYIWWVFAALPNEGNGIKEDGEFHIEIEFKPLKTTKTQVSFNCDTLYNDEDVYMENPLSGESKSITIDLLVNDNTSSDNSSESEDSSFNNNSIGTGSNDAPSNSTSSGNVSSEDNGNVSIDNSYVSDDEPPVSEPESDVEIGETVSSESLSGESDSNSMGENSVEFEESVSVSDSSTGVSLDSENENDNSVMTIIFVSIVVIAVIGGIIAFLIIKRRKQ